ncbi:MAG: glycosyltransferase [Thermomicrobiales bacterium]
MEALADPEVEGVVRYLGFVDDALLPQLYANAAGLIAASVEEGFDLPVLEGMAAGVPLLLSDIPVHREVARDFASHFDPHSVDAIVDGIIALVERSERDSDRMSRQQAMANRFIARYRRTDMANAGRTSMNRDGEQPMEAPDDDFRDDDSGQDNTPLEPTRKPTTREKFSVLLPALIAFGGMVLMLVIFLLLAA